MKEKENIANNIDNIIKDYESNSNTTIIVNFIIILILIILIRFLKGPIYLNSAHNNLLYDISITKNKIDKFTVTEKYQQPLIPIFIYYKDKTSNEYNSYTNTYFGQETSYKLNLNIYSCSKNNKEISCLKKYNKKTKIKYNKKKYKMAIKYNNNDNYLYNGPLINDLTKYLSQTGTYNITIEGTTNNINSNINFTINLFN